MTALVNIIIDTEHVKYSALMKYCSKGVNSIQKSQPHLPKDYELTESVNGGFSFPWEGNIVTQFSFQQ